MGFGMQKWIYTMRPRKPFSMQRKSSFTKIPTYRRTFKLQPSKDEKGYNFGILFFLILIVVIGLAIPKWLAQTKINNKEITELRAVSNTKAFNFLIKSGKQRLNSGSVFGAYSEFKLAYAIKPNDEKLNQLLFETLATLCIDYNRYCNALENLK